MDQTAAVATTETAARKPTRLVVTAIVLALAVLVAAVAVVGYPLVIVLGIAGTAAFLSGLVVLTAADLFFGKGK
ncbi:MAG TPA: hypothetical protein PKA55_01825 [Rhodoblastus sp.]|nr:hypothetical protein [Rhodoblastus sp.]